MAPKCKYILYNYTDHMSLHGTQIISHQEYYPQVNIHNTTYIEKWNDGVLGLFCGHCLG